MNTIQILGQKTVVADPKDSRNSIRPLLEESGFELDYERYSRTLKVRAGKDEIVRIIGVKGIQDFERIAVEREDFPYLLAGSDIVRECVEERARQILDLGIGRCFLKMITFPGESKKDLGDFETIITKYPKTLDRLLRAQLGGERQIPNIEYSDSPDTTLALLGARAGEKRKSIAAWEIVETGKSVKQLGLAFGENPDLIIPISTQLFSQKAQTENVDPRVQYFIEKIQKTLGLIFGEI